MSKAINSIIVEGADQQGKTTICKILSEKLGWKIQHYAKPPSNFNFHGDYLLEKNTISDRNFLSEIVYSNFRNSKHRVEKLNKLQDKFNVNKTILILVDREENFIFRDRKEDFTKEQIEKAILIYREEFKNLIVKKIKVNPNTEMHKIESLIRKIKR